MSNVLFLVLAGSLAGVLGTAGAITSLVSYPALLAVGLKAHSAAVANLVALVACWPGSAWASRDELAGTGRWLAWALPVAAVGAVLGSALLLATSSAVFSWIVPFLVATGSLALLADPARVARQRSGPQRPSRASLVPVWLISIYSGYFGSGSGVMLLALLLATFDARLPHANAAKNMLIGAGAVASATLFIVAGPVAWSATEPLAVGLLAGSLAGPRIARRLPEHFIRRGAAVLGLALAVDLLAQVL